MLLDSALFDLSVDTGIVKRPPGLDSFSSFDVPMLPKGLSDLLSAFHAAFTEVDFPGGDVTAGFSRSVTAVVSSLIYATAAYLWNQMVFQD